MLEANSRGRDLNDTSGNERNQHRRVGCPRNTNNTARVFGLDGTQLSYKFLGEKQKFQSDHCS